MTQGLPAVERKKSCQGPVFSNSPNFKPTLSSPTPPTKQPALPFRLGKKKKQDRKVAHRCFSSRNGLGRRQSSPSSPIEAVCPQRCKLPPTWRPRRRPKPLPPPRSREKSRRSRRWQRRQCGTLFGSEAARAASQPVSRIPWILVSFPAPRRRPGAFTELTHADPALFLSQGT